MDPFAPHRSASYGPSGHGARVGAAWDGGGSSSGDEDVEMAAWETASHASDDSGPPPYHANYQALPVNPVSFQFLVSQPDGKLNLAIDPKRPPPVRTPRDEERSALEDVPLLGTDWSRLNHLLAVRMLRTPGDLIRRRHRRAFQWFVLLEMVLYLEAFFSWISDGSDEEGKPKAIYAIVMVLADVLAMVGVHRRNKRVASLYVCVEAVHIACGVVWFIEPLLLFRVVVLLWAIQVRTGLVMEEVSAQLDVDLGVELARATLRLREHEELQRRATRGGEEELPHVTVSV